MSYRKGRYQNNGGDDRPRRSSGGISELGLPEIDIPFRDADPESGEIPVSELDTFNVPSRDEKGISETVHVSMPPIMLRHTDVIIRSNRFPYLRRADFIRHAIYRHIRWCCKLRRSLPRHIVVALESIMEDCRESEQRTRVEAVVRKISERIRFHLDSGDEMEARRLLSVMRERLDGVQDGYWTRETKRQLEDKFFKPMLDGETPKQKESQEIQ